MKVGSFRLRRTEDISFFRTKKNESFRTPLHAKYLVLDLLPNMSHPFPISHIQSLVLQRQKQRSVPTTAVPEEYYDALAFHESLKLGEFTFDAAFDRILRVDGKLVYILGSTQLQYEETEAAEEFEFMSLWCYDTRDGMYRRFEQRWKSGEDADIEDVQLAPMEQMKLYKTDQEFPTFQTMLESEDPKVFGYSSADWDSYTLETIDHDG